MECREDFKRMVLTLYPCLYSVLTYSQSSMSRASFAYRFLESLEMGISLLRNREGLKAILIWFKRLSMLCSYVSVIC